eukprot:2969689-Alexandrium_andersonii.AAC.1
MWSGVYQGNLGDTWAPARDFVRVHGACIYTRQEFHLDAITPEQVQLSFETAACAAPGLEGWR